MRSLPHVVASLAVVAALLPAAPSFAALDHLPGSAPAFTAGAAATTGWSPNLGQIADADGRVAGDVLYAVAAYLGLALVSGAAASSVGPWALGYCAAIELFKLTGFPLAWRRVPGARWIFGSVFGWHNLACYAVGVAGAWALDHWLGAHKSPRLPPPDSPGGLRRAP